MQQNTVTLVVAIVGICGTLSGVLLGQWMSQRSQRKQWRMDKRKEEWRELLTTLTHSFATICQLTGPMMVLDSDDQRKLSDAQTIAQTTIRDRIFIAKEVKNLKIYETWVTAARQFEVDKVYIPFSEQYALMNARIVDAATKDV
jgi:hypothetical protein